MEAVERLVRDLNQTWVDQRYDELAPYFDPQVVRDRVGSLPGNGVEVYAVDTSSGGAPKVVWRTQMRAPVTLT